MPYQKLSLRQVFSVEKIISVHYFEYFSDFTFEGENHDFWELLCVDKGEVCVCAGNRVHSLSKGEIIFHKPNEFHNVKANGKSAPNLVVIGFDCSSPKMHFFEDRVLTIDESERNLLATVVTEASNAFSTPLDDPYTQALSRKKDPLTGSEQMIRACLEIMFIQLYRRYTLHLNPSVITKTTKSREDQDTYLRILNYLNQHIHSQLTIEQICRDNLIGRSQLQKLFREKAGGGIIDTFSRLKISTAKRLIREKSLNFTQIADSLGYNSVHYFSRQFKKITGMTPSEYASSIKLLSERPLDWEASFDVMDPAQKTYDIE